MPTTADSVESSVSLSIRLRCFSRHDRSRWVAVCPSLDLASQGESEKESRAALQEAIELWFESCLERETLEAALRDVGFHLRRRGEPVLDEASRVTLRRGPARAVEPTDRGSTSPGHYFEIHREVPAFIAAQLVDSNAAAPAR